MPRKLSIAALSLVLSCLSGIPAAAGSADARSSAGAVDAAPNTWVPTRGPMAVARSGQSEVVLRDGMVLVVGGHSPNAELYDPATGRFSPTGSMSIARPGASVTLLGDGMVLVAGGCCLAGGVNFSSAELYDPATGRWTSTGSMVHGRSGQVAALLPDGTVLVAGGFCNGDGDDCDSGSFLDNQRTAEVYDPLTGHWASTGSMLEGRALATATLLRNGEVLVAGGFNSCDDDFCSDLNESELYAPASGTWSKTGSFGGARQQQTATLLRDGSVLLVGGRNLGGYGNPREYSSATIYDPATGQWTPTASLPAPRYGQTATALDNGWVLVTGGESATAEIFEPRRAVWVEPGSMSTVRTNAAATLLPSGDVLVTGGLGPDGRAQSTAEVYVAGPGPLAKLSATSLYVGSQLVGTTGALRSYTVFNYGDAPLAIDGVTVSGADPGDFSSFDDCGHSLQPGASCQVSARFSPGSTGLRTALIGLADNAPLSPQAALARGYGSGPNSFSPTGSMLVPRQGFTATLLQDGDVLIAGGDNNVVGPLAESELYDPHTGAFSPTGSLNVARTFAAASLLPDGDVLVAGGKGLNDQNLASAEVYTPGTGRWTMTAPMQGPGGFGITSTLLPDGDVLVDGIDAAVSAELYEPVSATWTLTGPTVEPDFDARATLLSDGDVLVAGDGSAMATLYDPSTNSWSQTGSMNVARLGPTMTLLRDGEVLAAGGSPPNGGPSLTSAELYDPAAGDWMVASALPSGRFGATAALLPDGDVLIVGGCTSQCGPGRKTSLLYQDGFFDYGPPTVDLRLFSVSAVLKNGSVLVAGGEALHCCSDLRSAEVYTSAFATVKPADVAPGATISVSGGGFYAGEPIRVTIDSQVTVGRVRTTSSGAFVLPATVPSDEAAGTHQIEVTGERSFATADAALTVT